MDTELFEECQRKYEEQEASAADVEAQRKKAWKRIESAAKARGKARG